MYNFSLLAKIDVCKQDSEFGQPHKVYKLVLQIRHVFQLCFARVSEWYFLVHEKSLQQPPAMGALMPFRDSLIFLLLYQDIFLQLKSQAHVYALQHLHLLCTTTRAVAGTDKTPDSQATLVQQNTTHQIPQF